MVAFYEGASIPWRESVPPPQYPTLNPNVLGNALANLVGNFQQAQQGQQRTQANDLGLQQERMRLDQAKAFAGGLPMNPDGTPNYSAITKTLAEKGDIGAIGGLGQLLMQERNFEGANAPDPLLGGGVSGIGTPSGGFMGALHEAESGNRNILSAVDPDPSGPGTRSQGYDQINVPTWLEFAPKAGVDTARYPTPMSAPESVQDQVAAQIPLGRFGARTRRILESKFGFGDDAKNLTVGELASRFGAGGGGKAVEVASAGASDVPASAYANPDQPSVPPVSAAAGSSIPRANAPTAVSAVGGPSPNPVSPNNPAWAGINAALPTGQGMGFPAMGVAPSPAPGTPPNAALGGTVAMGDSGLPKAVLPPGVGAPNQASVASIASSAGIPPQVAANIARAVGVAPDAPLNPQQALRAKAIVQNYAARAGQQSPGVAQGQPSSGGPIIPQFPLPRGFTDPQQAILAIDQDIARLSRFGPAAAGRIRALEDIRNRIAKSSAPMEVHPGQTILDPRTGKVLFQAAPTSAANVALQRYLQENPNASAEDVQQFLQIAHSRGGVTQEKADDIAQAIQSGDQPPVLTGLYGASALVRSTLAKNGFDLSKAQLQWDAAKKQITSLNGPQQVRFVGLANSVVNTIDEVKNLSQQMQLSGVPLLNKARLLSYIQAQGNTEKGQLATRYVNAVNTAKEEFANLANGGYAPTDAAWKLADEQINGNYGVKQLDAALTESQRLIKYRLAAMPGMSTAGPGAANRYFPGNEQAPPPPAETPAGKQGGPTAGQVEGGYRFKGGDPSKKENWEKVQ